jgi:hypothetical protein
MTKLVTKFSKFTSHDDMQSLAARLDQTTDTCVTSGETSLTPVMFVVRAFIYQDEVL